MGKLLVINLTDGIISFDEISEAVVRQCLGGFGFNTQYLFEHLTGDTDPLGPGNILVLSPGLLTGTAAPASSRLHISARSPLSGLMGSSNAGGFFGARLHALSVSGIVIKGCAPKPVWLHIDSEGARLMDAGDLWGMDTIETEGAVREKIGDRRAELLSIGPAGENLVRFACIMAGRDHAAGRTGLGAVMGSKRLKAISVSRVGDSSASDSRFGVSGAGTADSKTAELVKAYIRGIKENVSRFDDFSRLGSAGDILEMNERGVLGTRNYQEDQIDGAARIDGRFLLSYVVKRTSCHRCPVSCKAELELPPMPDLPQDRELPPDQNPPDAHVKGFRGVRPEYETIMNLGSLCGLDEPDQLVRLANLCNALGLDTISTGSAIAFAMELYEKGILQDRDTAIPGEENPELNWGNSRGMETLIRGIAYRKGFGNVLADGVARASRAIGKGAEAYAYSVKGVEIYGADPRGMMGTALAYAVSLRGGDFTSVYPVPEFRFSAERAGKEFGTEKAVDPFSTEGKGVLVRYSMIVSAVMDSLGICKVPALSVSGNFDLEKEAGLVSAITGFRITARELKRIGLRIINMEKLFNIRFGADASDDMLPRKFLEDPVKEGPAEGVRVNLQPMIHDFYSAMGWDENGIPLPETVISLGL